MLSHEVRERFLRFFESKGHCRVSSSSLIPANDPTLMFANAGMNQFKDLFLGREERGYTRAASSQKCVRAGGKHNDLDNVGYTARHHTFFEMLGNFSFGDYFKEQAITFAWEFLTLELGIPKDRLYVTVYQDDDEAFAIWRDQQGVPEDRIFRFGKKDNFWSMGDTGPCGPCSEIFYDYGDAVPGPTDPYEAIASGSGRITEMWNLVFMEFNAKEDGTLEPLPNPSIDTGMGLERICTVTQGVFNNYDTDIFRDLIEPVAAQLGVSLVESPQHLVGLRVIADHLRAMTFLIADGVRPSNEGRGYVLRRIMRRAMRFGKQMGQADPFLCHMIRFVVEKMSPIYPELVQEQTQIELLVKVEEQIFDTTLSKGLPILAKYIDQIGQQGAKRIPGQVIHYLYGTHGFPIDLMEDIARENDLSLDHDGYRLLMEQEAKASREAGDFSAKSIHPIWEESAKQFQTEALHYGELVATGRIKRLFFENGLVNDLKLGQKAILVLDRTSFYAESGGQIGDQGEIITHTGRFRVNETTKVLDKLVLHQGEVIEGGIHICQDARTEVNPVTRRATMKNHTATHLLHKALRDILGLHIRQAGSLVDPDKLRFDFSHFEPMTVDQIAEVERLVNEQILNNLPVETLEMDQSQAKESGAIAFFGEKYGARVRVVRVGDFSKEFCGGTHVQSAGEIGCFKILSEKGLAAGVRRILALTGPRAIERFQESENLLRQVQESYNFTREDLLSQLKRLQDEKRALEQSIGELKLRLAKGGHANEQIEDLGKFKVVVKQVEDVDGGDLRQLADELLHKTNGGVVLLGAKLGDKVQLLVKSGRAEVHAGKLVGAMAVRVGGKGGGKPEMAMAGGKDTEKLAEALQYGLECLKSEK